jgi:hypothetical protein
VICRDDAVVGRARHDRWLSSKAAVGFSWNRARILGPGCPSRLEGGDVATPRESILPTFRSSYLTAAH